jgi:polysaccharide biosynthesis protein PslG
VIEFAPPDGLAKELDGYVELGAGWIRFDAKWGVVEPEPGQRNWAPYDRLVDESNARGIRVLMVVGYPPDWAQPERHASRVDPAAYARFAADLVERYAPRGVRHYELWNEPNLSNFWLPAPDPPAYAELVKTAYPAMKAEEEDTTILIGALAPVGGREPPECAGGATKVNPIPFLQELLRHGVRGSFDALSYHAYTDRALPGEEHPCNAWHQLEGTEPSLRSVLEDAGEGDKEIWVTEFGGAVDEVGEAHQAKLVEAALRLWPTYPWAGALLVYTYRDRSTDHRYDLAPPDGRRRPAWEAFRAGVAAPRGRDG